MRHRKHRFKLGRTHSHREALAANLIKSLIVHGSVVTTISKAKFLRAMADKMVTLAKKGDLSSIRRINSELRIYRNNSTKNKTEVGASSNNLALSKIAEIAKINSERQGGYTRVIRMHQRKGDAAEMCKLEYVTTPYKKNDSEKN